jgi:hypothetical protein
VNLLRLFKLSAKMSEVDYLSPYEVEHMVRDIKNIDIKEFGSSE